jgi:predicted exporter
MDPELRKVLGSETWHHQALEAATRAGLDAMALERPLAALRASAEEAGHVARSLQSIAAPPAPVAVRDREGWSLLRAFRGPSTTSHDPPMLTIPIRLDEAAQDRAIEAVEAAGGRLIGTRPLFRALKSVARVSLRDALLVALAAVLLTVGFFGQRVRFVFFALVPLLAGLLGALGLLGLSGEPLTFLSVVALPIALGVSVDTAMNLLHRARHEAAAAHRVARVNAVCAGTTLAGFGGLVFSAYRGLRGLGLVGLGGVALALLVTQWLLPVLLEKWPLHREPE